MIPYSILVRLWQDLDHLWKSGVGKTVTVPASDTKAEHEVFEYMPSHVKGTVMDFVQAALNRAQQAKDNPVDKHGGNYPKPDAWGG